MLPFRFQQNSHLTAQSVQSAAPLTSRKAAKVKDTPGAGGSYTGKAQLLGKDQGYDRYKVQPWVKV